ncbi:amidohydrolase family protein [Microbispora rosea]|uniref:amidohydrolase family protein n=1 Tax=Microbispora rosea TaxID=58117 RepID=UPI003D8ED4B1
MPGFNDAHHHLSMRGQRLRELDLRDGQVGTLDEVYAKVAERAAGLPQDAWVKGAGYDQNKLGGLHPSREGARRAAGGRPDGLLAEQAQGLADAVLRPVPFEDFVEGIALAGRVAAGEGLTSFTEPGIGRGLAGNGAWDLAAAMCCDYEGEPGNRGLLQQDAEALRAFILRAHAAGWQIATHAIGDRAVDVVLDAYEEAQARDPRPDARHRIEHCAVTSDAQVARIARLGVIPVPQGRFVSELGDGMLAALGRGTLLPW